MTGKASSSELPSDVLSSLASSTVDKGFIDCALACAISITMTNSDSFSSESSSRAWSFACSNVTGESLVTSVVSNRTKSLLSTRFLISCGSSLVRIGNFSSINQAPTNACPFVTATTGFNPIASMQLANNKEESRQATIRELLMSEARRILCPVLAKPCGGLTYASFSLKTTFHNAASIK